MPRTSYGETKLKQAWQVVAALMERKRQQVNRIQLCQNNEGRPYLSVEASLSDIANWSELTIDKVRETLTQHLGESFLNIFIDQREKLAGRGSEQWKFKLRLWSTDLEENWQHFQKNWQTAKSGNVSQEKKLDSQTLSLNSSNHIQQVDDLDTLFQQIRDRCHQKILKQHSRIRLLNNCEVKIDQIYVDVWLLDRPEYTLYKTPSSLLKTFDIENDRLALGRRIGKRTSGLKIARTLFFLSNRKLCIKSLIFSKFLIRMKRLGY